MASFDVARQNYQLIDTRKDHIARKPLRPDIVYDFIDRGSVNMNSPRGEEWEAILLQEDNFLREIYNYCLCGHEIIHNYLLRNKETRKAFVVGCVCVKKIKSIKIPTTSKICIDCGETVGRVRSSYCNICRIGHNSSIYINKYKRTIVWKDLLDNYPDYCEWVVQTDFKQNRQFQNLKDWLLNFYEVVEEPQVSPGAWLLNMFKNKKPL